MGRLFYFFIMKLAPEFEGVETGVGHEMVVKAVSKSCGKSVQQIRDAFKKEGDLGIVAAISKKTQKNLSNFFSAPKADAKKKTGLLFKDVFARFEQLSRTSGGNSVAEKEQIIVKLLQEASSDEGKFICRWLEKNLRTGVAEKTVLSSLARAFCYTPPHLLNTKEQILDNKRKLGPDQFNELCVQVEFSIKEATCEYPDFGAIIEQLLVFGPQPNMLKEACHMRVGVPLKPMLAKPTKGVNIVLKRFEGLSFTCEYKYDGFRGQIHFYREEGHLQPTVAIYSRNLENLTQAYPDIVQFLQGVVGDEIGDFILDAELVAYDVNNDKILPFSAV